MWSVWCWVLLTLFKGTSQYSIFGGNAYGYTGSSHCAAFNGCVSREIEDEDGKPKATFGPSGTRQVGEECRSNGYEKKVRNGDAPIAITQVTNKLFPIKFPIANGGITSYEDAERLVNNCNDETPLCKWLKEDEYSRTRLQEIFKYQMLLDDNSVLRNNQGAVWRWITRNLTRGEINTYRMNGIRIGDTWSALIAGNDLGMGNDENKRKELLNKECNADCMENLYRRCTDVVSIRHVRDWCATILSWIETSELDKYQHYLLHLVSEITKLSLQDKWHYRQIDIVSREERAVLVAAAASTVFLTKELFSFPEKSGAFEESIQRLGYPAIHSLFLANYVGRLRVTLHKKPEDDASDDDASNDDASDDDASNDDASNDDASDDEKWGKAGTLVTMSKRGVERARNYEGLTGSVYASIAALFNEQKSSNMRFRLEIAEENNIGCVEQTTGMVFIRPADWAPTSVTWKSIGSKKFAPSGVIALDEQNRSTFEITEGGLVMYPVAIGDLLVTKAEDSVCNSAKGNWKAEQQSFNLKGIGGMCNWVPTW